MTTGRYFLSNGGGGCFPLFYCQPIPILINILKIIIPANWPFVFLGRKWKRIIKVFIKIRILRFCEVEFPFLFFSFFAYQYIGLPIPTPSPVSESDDWYMDFTESEITFRQSGYAISCIQFGLFLLFLCKIFEFRVICPLVI